MNGPAYAASSIRSMSLEQIEEELTRVERTVAALRDAMRRAHGESAADNAALREMGTRAKAIMARPKGWGGGSKKADAAELGALQAQIRTRSDTMNRTMEDLKVKSAEARELDKRQQALNTRRAELMNQRG